MNHRDALEKLADGESVTLEQYADRKTAEGMAYRVSLAGGELSLQMEACSREPLEDKPVDEWKLGIMQSLVRLNQGGPQL